MGGLVWMNAAFLLFIRKWTVKEAFPSGNNMFSISVLMVWEAFVGKKLDLGLENINLDFLQVD